MDNQNLNIPNRSFAQIVHQRILEQRGPRQPCISEIPPNEFIEIPQMTPPMSPHMTPHMTPRRTEEDNRNVLIIINEEEEQT